MGLFTKKTTTPASATLEPTNPNNVKSEDTTAVPSQNVSDTDSLKSRDVETTVVDEKGSDPSQGRGDAARGTNEPAVPFEGSPYHPPETGEKTREDVQVQSDAKSTTSASVVVPAGVSAEDEDEIVYPGGLKLALITLALCLSVFLVALDNTIIATAIPKITDHFNSLGDVGWYGSSYLLTTCALQLFFGKSVPQQI